MPLFLHKNPGRLVYSSDVPEASYAFSTLQNMKKLIDGVLYNTDKASVLAEFSSGHSGDFRFVSETLYRTVKGSFLLHGEGGAMSRYREAVDNNSWIGGESLQKLSPEEVLRWMEHRGKTDSDVIALLGDLVKEE